MMCVAMLDRVSHGSQGVSVIAGPDPFAVIRLGFFSVSQDSARMPVCVQMVHCGRIFKLHNPRREECNACTKLVCSSSSS